jgi:hypothetical protein
MTYRTPPRSAAAAPGSAAAAVVFPWLAEMPNLTDSTVG